MLINLIKYPHNKLTAIPKVASITLPFHCFIVLPVDGTAKRLKRHQTKVLEKTIELSVVVDDSLHEQQNLTTYILRIINTVSGYKQQLLISSKIG